MKIFRYNLYGFSVVVIHCQALGIPLNFFTTVSTHFHVTSFWWEKGFWKSCVYPQDFKMAIETKSHLFNRPGVASAVLQSPPFPQNLQNTFTAKP